MQHKIIHVNNPKRWTLVSRLSMHSRKHKRLMRFAKVRCDIGRSFTISNACDATSQTKKAVQRRLDWLIVAGVLVRSSGSYRLAVNHQAAAHAAGNAELRP